MARLPGKSRKFKVPAPKPEASAMRTAFEKALARSLPGEPLAERVRWAAAACAGEFLFALPAADGAMRALVRLGAPGGGSIVLEVRSGGSGESTLVVEEDIDAALLGFARASIAVMEHLKADARVVAPLAAAT